MNLRSRITKLEEADTPPASRNPLAGLAARMRAREGQPRSSKEPLPGSLAWRIRERAARRTAADLT